MKPYLTVSWAPRMTISWERDSVKRVLKKKAKATTEQGGALLGDSNL